MMVGAAVIWLVVVSIALYVMRLRPEPHGQGAVIFGQCADGIEAGAGPHDLRVQDLHLDAAAGLEPLPDDAMLDWSAMTAALARQRPWWEPDSTHGYHVNTFGYLVGEVLRRATGESVGRFLRDRVATPLGADVHIGLPASEHARVA